MEYTMATKMIQLSGAVKWVHIDPPDLKYGKKYTVNLYLDDVNMKAYLDSGLQLKINEDEDGKFVRIRRDDMKLIKGESVIFGPPKVEGAEPSEIGNGSEVICLIAVYDTVKGPGHRLEKVIVNRLVEYIPIEGQEAPDVDLQ